MVDAYKEMKSIGWFLLWFRVDGSRDKFGEDLQVWVRSEWRLRSQIYWTCKIGRNNCGSFPYLQICIFDAKCFQASCVSEAFGGHCSHHLQWPCFDCNEVLQCENNSTLSLTLPAIVTYHTLGWIWSGGGVCNKLLTWSFNIEMNQWKTGSSNKRFWRTTSISTCTRHHTLCVRVCVRDTAQPNTIIFL